MSVLNPFSGVNMKTQRTVEINLNGDVLVQLTPMGKDELKRQNREPPREDKEGWSRWQFNELWMTFAHVHSLGRDCFSSVVKFVLT